MPTEAPAETPLPTEAPAPSPTQQVIDQNAESAVIEGMQQYLRDTLGYLTDGAYTPGTYDDATINAVIAFQMRVNEVDGYERLTVSGVCDYATYEAMVSEGFEKYVNPNHAQPTAEPAPTESAPTPEPTQAPVVGPDSDANTISQKMCIRDRTRSVQPLCQLELVVQICAFIQPALVSPRFQFRQHIGQGRHISPHLLLAHGLRVAVPILSLIHI